MQKECTLWYNAARERYGLLDEMDCWDVDGLHCGTCFDALIWEHWLPVRLEYSDVRYPLTRGWYLCDGNGALKKQPRLDGLRIRFR